MNFKATGKSGKGNWGCPRQPAVCKTSTLPTLPLCRPRPDAGSAAEPGNSQGVWAGGRRAGPGGRSPRLPPPRPSGCPPRLPERGGAGARPEEQQEERSESSPGALRDRVPGSGGDGRGSAPAGE